MPRKSLLIIAIFLVVLSLSCIGVLLTDGDNLAAAGVDSEANCCPEQEQTVLKLTKPYMKGPEIAEYQVALRELGYYKGKIDGVYSHTIAKSVKEFQRRSNLEDDGVIGAETGRALATLFETGAAHISTQAAPKGVVEIVIDVDRKKLIVYENQKKFKEYNVAVGEDKTPTPIGEWRIARKAKNWGTGFGTRWLGLNVPWGIYGIHGTNKPWSIGTNASHGCIRMMNHNVEEIYPWVKTGTVVRIIGEVYPPLYEERDKVFKGCIGTVVVMIQKGLAAEGYLKSRPDGIFGSATEDALKKLQKDKGFEVTGQVDVDIWPVLGL